MFSSSAVLKSIRCTRLLSYSWSHRSTSSSHVAKFRYERSLWCPVGSSISPDCAVYPEPPLLCLNYQKPLSSRRLTTMMSSSSLTMGRVPDQQLSHQPTDPILLEILQDDETEAKITKLTLNRPKANAMGRELIQRLNDCLDQLLLQLKSKNLATSSRCLVITSYSEKVFSAGADLKERATMTQEEAADFVCVLRNTMEKVSRLPIPVIAAMEGVAVGGGLELALAADLRIASSTATLGFPETSLAIVPGAGGTQRLPRLAGVARAKELIWTGRKITGREALEYGLVTEIVQPGQTTNRAVELAFHIASHGPVAIRASKDAIDRGVQYTSMEDALEVERQCYAQVLPTQDRLEGLAAFKEGRKPKYTGQ